MKAEGKYINVHQRHIDGCMRGDSESQFEIYKLYHSAMYNTCLRMVGNAADAEDIMQESFFKAFDKLSTYRNEVSFGAWLKRIVVNSALDFLKKRKLQLTPIDQAYGLRDENELDDDFSADSVEKLKQAIANLPEGYKLVVNLVLVEGYSHDEVGEMLNISASTSRSQLARAKQKLIEMLKSM